LRQLRETYGKARTIQNYFREVNGEIAKPYPNTLPIFDLFPTNYRSEISYVLWQKRNCRALFFCFIFEIILNKTLQSDTRTSVADRRASWAFQQNRTICSWTIQ